MPRTPLTQDDCSPFTLDGPGLHAKLAEHDAALDAVEGGTQTLDSLTVDGNTVLGDGATRTTRVNGSLLVVDGSNQAMGLDATNIDRPGLFIAR